MRPLTPADQADLLALNNAHAAETSLLDQDRLDMMLRTAFLALVIGKVAAFLIAFDQDAEHDSANFRWFRERYGKFVYVDRIITEPAERGRGHARHLYESLFAEALIAGHDRIVCEVNLHPPNPISDRFHAALGFVEVGRAAVGNTDNMVRYLSRPCTAR
ncbi:GNAT family N-acetyltransferase [Lichenicoccus sp.]|uniref:GNAT family N-acetyltransferase n=1 Tax=Lichenicoccus sp. TaxID=2781899 RepID=UPI003D0F1822